MKLGVILDQSFDGALRLSFGDISIDVEERVSHGYVQRSSRGRNTSLSGLKVDLHTRRSGSAALNEAIVFPNAGPAKRVKVMRLGADI